MTTRAMKRPVIEQATIDAFGLAARSDSRARVLVLILRRGASRGVASSLAIQQEIMNDAISALNKHGVEHVRLSSLSSRTTSYFAAMMTLIDVMSHQRREHQAT